MAATGSRASSFCKRIAEAGELKEIKEIPRGGREKEKGAIKIRKP